MAGQRGLLVLKGDTQGVGPHTLNRRYASDTPHQEAGLCRVGKQGCVGAAELAVVRGDQCWLKRGACRHAGKQRLMPGG